MENNYYPFINTPLPYAFDALEPYIDAKTMYLHHDRHLQTYIDNLNDALKNEPELQKLSLEQLIRISCKLPKRLQAPIRNNAGGVYNHRFFFKELAPPPQALTDTDLLGEINHFFGSLENFNAAFKKAALSVFGSGYAWLVKDNSALKIVTTPNQVSPVEQHFQPVLTVDVWEHAYYLKHYNVRSDYIDDWFQVIDWQQVRKNFLASQKQTL